MGPEGQKDSAPRSEGVAAGGGSGSTRSDQAVDLTACSDKLGLTSSTVDANALKTAPGSLYTYERGREEKVKGM